MSKLLMALLIATATVGLANGDFISDLLNGDQSVLNGLEIIRILLNPNQPLENKVAEIFVNTALMKLAENGEAVNLKLDQANSVDIGQIFTMDAALTDAQGNKLQCQVTLLLHFITNMADVTFACDGQPVIAKEIPWMLKK